MKGEIILKENYEAPEMEVIIFDTDDVITTSGVDDEGDDP